MIIFRFVHAIQVSKTATQFAKILLGDEEKIFMKTSKSPLLDQFIIKVILISTNSESRFRKFSRLFAKAFHFFTLNDCTKLRLIQKYAINFFIFSLYKGSMNQLRTKIIEATRFLNYQ